MSKKENRRKSQRIKAAKKRLSVARKTVTYGILNTKENIWYGDNDGPRLFDDLFLARLSAEVTDVQLGNPLGTTRAVPFTSAKRLIDEVPVRMSGDEALRKLEEGYLR